LNIPATASARGYVVVPPGALDHDDIYQLLSTRIAGMPLLVRQLRTLKAAGCYDLSVVCDPAQAANLASINSGSFSVRCISCLDPQLVNLSDTEDRADKPANWQVAVVLDVFTVLRPDAVYHAIAATAQDELFRYGVNNEERLAVAVFRADCIRPAIEAFLTGVSTPDPVGHLGDRVSSLDTAILGRVSGPQSARIVEERLWDLCRKPEDGLVSRYFNRHLSIAFSRRIARYPVHPNHVSIANFGLALVACWLVSKPDYSSILVAALLFQLNSILDGVDGELARVRHQSSLVGEWIDTITDDLSNILFSGALGVSVWRATGNTDWLWLAAASMAPMLGNMAYNYLHLARMKRGDVLATGWFAMSRSRAPDRPTVKQKLVALGTTVFRQDFLVGLFLIFAVLNLAHIALLIILPSAWIVFLANMGLALTGRADAG